MLTSRSVRGIVVGNVKPVGVIWDLGRVFSSATVRLNADLSENHKDSDDIDDTGEQKVRLARRRRNRIGSESGGLFVDLRRVRLQAGRGGDGIMHFGREPFKAIAPADGGNGGRGSHIWISVGPTGRDLRGVKVAYTADSGQRGRTAYAKGANGRDLMIVVPKGTVLSEYIPKHEATATAAASPSASDSDSNSKGGVDVDQEKQQVRREDLFIDTSDPLMPIGTRFLVARGGDSGRGNASFVSATNRSPDYFTEGKVGELRYVQMELKCIADIGLVGLPNAGKSSFIRAVSRCNTRIGHWAFTTLRPHIGTVKFPATVTTVSDHSDHSSDDCGAGVKVKPPPRQVQPQKVDVNRIFQDQLQNSQNGCLYFNNDDQNLKNQNDEIEKRETAIIPPFSLTIADIPGIIEGAASLNRGLGHEFLRHIERSKLVAYILDLSRDEPWTDLKVLQTELDTHKRGLGGGTLNHGNAETTAIGESATVAADDLTKRMIVIANKCDEEGAQERFQELQRRLPNVQMVMVSSKEKLNIDAALWQMRRMVEDAADDVNLNQGDLQSKTKDDSGYPDWMKQVRGVHKVEVP